MMNANPNNNDLIKWLRELDNLELLQNLRSIAGLESEYDFWDDLSEKQKKGIEMAQKSFKEGDGVPMETVMLRLRAKYGTK